MRGNIPSHKAFTGWILCDFRRNCLKMFETKGWENTGWILALIHYCQNMKANNKLEWNNRINIHVRKLHIERKDDAGISAMKNYHSSASLFTSRKARKKLQWRASTLESFPTNPLSLPLQGAYLYYLRPETNPRNKTCKLFSVTIRH